MARTPQAHTTNRISGRELPVAIGAAFVNTGSATSPITNETAGPTIAGAFAANLGTLNNPPNDTSTPNGTKNFTTAASQTPYRVRARFFRSPNVSPPAAAANKVDCQRCAAIVCNEIVEI